eukprot:11271523-Prorocentrum_lima.AAC.1
MNLLEDNFWYSLAIELRADEKAYKNKSCTKGMAKYGYSLRPERTFPVAIWLTIQPPSAIRYN